MYMGPLALAMAEGLYTITLCLASSMLQVLSFSGAGNALIAFLNPPVQRLLPVVHAGNQ